MLNMSRICVLDSRVSYLPYVERSSIENRRLYFVRVNVRWRQYVSTTGSYDVPVTRDVDARASIVSPCSSRALAFEWYREITKELVGQKFDSPLEKIESDQNYSNVRASRLFLLFKGLYLKGNKNHFATVYRNEKENKERMIVERGESRH